MKTPTVCYLGLLMAASNAIANDLNDGKDLYEKAGPNAAFVRMVNLNEFEVVPRFAGSDMAGIGYCIASDTVIVDAGQHTLKTEEVEWRANLERGQIYTLVIHGSEVREFSNPLTRDPMRANFEVFNLSATTLESVRTSSGKQSVFSALQPNSFDTRPLNPLRVELEISGSEKVFPVDPIAFVRGKTTSLMICGTQEDLTSSISTE